MSEDIFGKGSESTGDGEHFRAADHEGRIVMFLGHQKELFDGGDFKPANVARCQLILVLDTDEGVKAYQDALVFGAALAPTVYRNPKQAVLGIIGKGTAKPGRSAPWILSDCDEVQTDAANKFYKDKVKVSDAGAFFYAPDEAPF